MSLKLASSGGGSVDITAPSTASNLTVTLPSASGTLVDTASAQTLTNKTLTVTGASVLVPTADTGQIGYGTGAGGTVTQTGSRTSGVTLSKPTGKITMVTAAGTASWQSFTVTNTLVSTNDIIVISIDTATNFYSFTTKAATGSFQVWFAAVSGTASDALIINFAIIKGATA